MKKNFGDKSLTIQYIQKLISENYNDKVLDNGEYYKVIDNNYGLAHYIARYLDYMYPVLDEDTRNAYEAAKLDNNLGLRKLYEPISISNYFLCSNNGGKLSYYPSDVVTDSNPTPSKRNKKYMDIYSKDMCVKQESADSGLVPYNPYIINQNKYDLPLLVYTTTELSRTEYHVSNNSIYTLDNWVLNKEICELDDLVTSFLLGRVIGPKSSREEIAYVQRLLIRDRNIEERELGVWKIDDPYNPDRYDLGKTIMSYQRSIASNSSVPNVFVTGYFDIFTESCALRENGVEYNGILGL